MPQPFEIIAGAADVWVGPPLEPDVAINVVPGANWVKLGTSGSKDYDEEGVVLHAEQDIAEFFGLGGTGPQKAFRNREGFWVTFNLHDATLESFKQALNQSAITTLAGPPAEKTIPLLQGATVVTRALLVRSSVSAYADSANVTQLWIPLAYQRANLEAAFKKNEARGLAMDWRALQDVTNGFGKLHMPTA